MDPLRQRQERIKDRSSKPVTQKPPQRVYTGGGAGGTWYVLRYVGSDVMRGHQVVYSADTPVEGDVEVVGDMVELYPAPGYLYANFSPCVFELAHPDMALAITENPDPDAPTYDDDLAAYNQALADENLSTVFYPVKADAARIAETPMMMSPNVAYLDELQEMSEGSGI